MRFWRICKAAHAPAAFDGEGAKRVGGRWNSKGVALAYASTSVSLAAIELFVHLDPEDMPGDLVLAAADVPDGVPLRTLAPADLPPTWDAVPMAPEIRKIGDRWVGENGGLVLLVPSAIVPEENNCLLNPKHPEFARISSFVVRPFGFDPRMWK